MRIQIAFLLVCMAAFSTLFGTDTSSTDAVAQQHDRSDFPKIRVQVNVYEVTGKALETLKPMDLDGLKALVAESRGLPSVAKDGAKLIASPFLTVPAGDNLLIEPSRMSVGQTLYVDAQGRGFSSADGHPAAQLREINTGVQLQVRAWLDIRSEQVLLQTQLEVSDFEGFTEIEAAGSGGRTQLVFIPIVKTMTNHANHLLKSGSTEILAWQDEFSGTPNQPKQKLVVVTITPTFRR